MSMTWLRIKVNVDIFKPVSETSEWMKSQTRPLDMYKLDGCWKKKTKQKKRVPSPRNRRGLRRLVQLKKKTQPRKLYVQSWKQLEVKPSQANNRWLQSRLQQLEQLLILNYVLRTISKRNQKQISGSQALGLQQSQNLDFDIWRGDASLPLIWLCCSMLKTSQPLETLFPLSAGCSLSFRYFWTSCCRMQLFRASQHFRDNGSAMPLASCVFSLQPVRVASPSINDRVCICREAGLATKM